MAGLKFQAERAAFGLAADKVLKYMNKTDDRTKALLKLVDLTENFAKNQIRLRYTTNGRQTNRFRLSPAIFI